ncbi:MAG: hypothetical protein ACLQU2_26205 [Candidatus Binataceae bacterium]
MHLAHRLRLMLTGFCATLAAVMAFNFLVNPLGAWRHRLVPGLYRRVSLQRVATPYLLRTSTPQTLLLGSSRVFYGMQIVQGVKDGFENAALSGSSLQEISKEVDLALRNPHLKRIIWGLDFYTFDEFRDEPNPDTCARLDGDWSIRLTDTILSTVTLKMSWRMLWRAVRGHVSEDARMPIPWPAPFICTRFAHPPPPTLAGIDQDLRFRQVTNLPEYRHFDYSPKLEKFFLQVVGRIRRAHVQLIAFVAPVTEYELEMIRQNERWPEFQRWKRFLADNLPYTDFSGYNEIARSDRMFIDAWHIEPAVGAVIMRRLLGLPECDCADAMVVWNSALPMNARDAEAMLALQEQRMAAATAEPNVYSTTVAAAIAKRYGPPLPPLSAHR